MLKIPFHRPIVPKDINITLQESLNSGWLTTGPKVNDFEERLKCFLNVKHVIALNSCTAGLHLSLASIGLGKNDLFIAPTYTFVATVEAGEYLGAKPILVDSDSDTFNLDIDQVEKMPNSIINKLLFFIYSIIHERNQAARQV